MHLVPTALTHMKLSLRDHWLRDTEQSTKLQSEFKWLFSCSKFMGKFAFLSPKSLHLSKMK